jgi:DNA-directed RNA polymerase I, II, and III subunit RPABC2
MSYFDNNLYNGADGSDADEEDKKSDSSSISDNEEDVVAEGKGDSDFEEVGEEDIDVDEIDEDVDEIDEDVDEDEDEDIEKAEAASDDDDGAINKADSDQDDVEDIPVASKKKSKKIPTRQKSHAIVYDEEDDEDPTGEVYLQKFDKEINDNYLVNFHPESAIHNYDEILVMTKVVRDKNGIIIDELHKTIPYLTKYEKARVLGQRAKQINSGATVFVKVPEKVIDGYLIAELELQEKRVPFIIRRPMPNGGSEYWSIKDLENISF